MPTWAGRETELRVTSMSFSPESVPFCRPSSTVGVVEDVAENLPTPTEPAQNRHSCQNKVLVTQLCPDSMGSH